MRTKPAIIIIVFLFFLPLLLLSCTEKAQLTEPAEGAEEPAIPGGKEMEQPLTAVPTNETIPVTPSGPCPASWVCLGSNAKIYRYENCSLGKREDCQLGCVNDECRKPETCTPGFKCKGQYYSGYQLEDCSWINQVKCEWGCEEAECLLKPNETTTAPATTATPSPPATVSTTPKVTALKTGEMGTFEVGGEQHTIRIYNLEETRARLEMDGQRSDWVEEGSSVTFTNGIKIKLFAVLYRGTSSSLPSEIEYVVE